jgi:hypothetical protein
MYKQHFSVFNLMAATGSIAVGLAFVVAMEKERMGQRLFGLMAMTFFFSLAAGILCTRRPVVYALWMLLVGVGLLVVSFFVGMLVVHLLHWQ